MTLLLRASQLQKQFGTRRVLADISMMVHSHEVVCVLGEVGAGKTTLLRCLNLLEYIDGGVIEFGGHPVIEGLPTPPTIAKNGGAAEHLSARPRRILGGGRRPRYRVCVNENHYRQKFGAVFESHNLFPNRTVLENLIEGPVHVLKQRRRVAVDAALDLLAIVGLADHVHAYPSDLEPALRQRAAIARALAMKPDVLLLDEITADLDPARVVDLLRLVHELRETHNAAMIMVTNHLAFVREAADRVYFLHQGRVVEKGAARKHLADPQTPEFRQFLTSVRASR